MPLGFDNRLFLSWLVWRAEPDGSVVVATGPLENYNGDPSGMRQMAEFRTKYRLGDASFLVNKTIGSTEGYWKIIPRGDNVCEVTLVQYADVKGSIPGWVINSRLVSHLGILRRIQTRFMRHGPTVDKEVRESFPPPPQYGDLSEEQKAFFEGVRTKLGENDAINYKAINSKNYLAQFKVEYNSLKGNRRKTALGQATATLDCSAKDAVAWYTAFTSRERMRIHHENKHHARFVVSRDGEHDEVVANIKHLPFPLNNREFVYRQLCATDGATGALLVAGSSVPLVVDYGETNFNCVRGTTSYMLRVVDTHDTGQCHLIFTVYLDAGGHIPIWLGNKKVPMALSVTTEMVEDMQRDAEVDAANEARVAATIRDVPQTYTDEELRLWNMVRKEVGGTFKGFNEIDNSKDHNLKMGANWTAGTNYLCLFAQAIVDASVPDCAAFEMAKSGRREMKAHFEKGGLWRSFKHTNDHNIDFTHAKDYSVPGIQPREWHMRIIWKWIDEKTLHITYSDVDHDSDHDSSGGRRDSVRRSMSGVHDRRNVIKTNSDLSHKFETLEPINGVPQTRVTYTTRMDLKGIIPGFIIQKQGASHLMCVSRMRTRFDRTLEIDTGKRAEFAEMFRSTTNGMYSREENEVIEHGIRMEQLFLGGDAKKKKVLKSTFPGIVNEVTHEEGDEFGWGQSITQVRASVEDILSFLWYTDAKCKWTKSDIERCTLEKINDHHWINYVVKKGKHSGIADLKARDGVSRTVWKKLPHGGALMVGVPALHESRPRMTGASKKTRGSSKTRGTVGAALRAGGMHEVRDAALEAVEESGPSPFKRKSSARQKDYR